MFADHVRRMARYNVWANGRIYDAVAALPQGAFEAERPAFFRSIKGTLNHLLVGDRIWLAFLTGTEHGIERLNTTLYDDLASLRAAREAEDKRLGAFVAALDDAYFSGTLRYRSVLGDQFETPLAVVFAHIFNHHAHHRGQVHDLLSQTAVPPPVLDLHRFHAAEASGAA